MALYFEKTLCSICCEEFRQPKILNCGHSFCSCLNDLMKVDPLICPLCRRQISKPASGLAEDFPTNFALLSFVQSDSFPSNITTTVMMLDEVGQLENKPKMCSVHDKVLNKCCETCEELLCEECVTEEHGDDHEIVTDMEALNAATDELKITIEEVRLTEESIDEMSKATKEAMSKCKADTILVKTAITDAEESLIELLRQKVKPLLSEVDDAKMAAIKEFKQMDLKVTDLSFLSNSIKCVGESLLADLKNKDIKRRGLVNLLSQRKDKVQTYIKEVQEAQTSENLGVKDLTHQRI